MASSSTLCHIPPTQFHPTGRSFPSQHSQHHFTPLFTLTSNPPPFTSTLPFPSVPTDLTPTTLKSIEQSILQTLGEDVGENYIQESQQHSGNFVPPLPTSIGLCFRKKMLTRWAEEKDTDEGVEVGADAKVESKPVAEVVNTVCSVSIKTKGKPNEKSVKKDDTQISKVQVRKRSPKNKGKDDISTNDKPSEEDEQSRIQRRREMNKLAAARCRKRRADRTIELTLETEGLEADRSAMLKQIQELQVLQHDLQSILGNHPCAKKQARWEVPANLSNFTKSSGRNYPYPGKSQNRFNLRED